MRFLILIYMFWHFSLHYYALHSECFGVRNDDVLNEVACGVDQLCSSVFLNYLKF